jgi:hypothetical protein
MKAIHIVKAVNMKPITINLCPRLNLNFKCNAVNRIKNKKGNAPGLYSKLSLILPLYMEK